MTETELERLERDVAQARSRLTGDIARMRGPSVLSEFKRDLISRATIASRDGAWGVAHRVLKDIKDRAAANPAAALAIGAGVASRLVRHPPLSTMLVGLGVAGLLKTDPEGGMSPVVARAAESANSAGELVQGMGEEARQWAMRGRRSAREMLDQSSTIASAGISRAGEAAVKASGAATETADTLLRVISHKEVRDKYLLGVAALAIGAVAVIAHQRRDV
jgi:hypothetical protein